MMKNKKKNILDSYRVIDMRILLLVGIISFLCTLMYIMIIDCNSFECLGYIGWILYSGVIGSSALFIGRLVLGFVDALRKKK